MCTELIRFTRGESPALGAQQLKMQAIVCAVMAKPTAFVRCVVHNVDLVSSPTRKLLLTMFDSQCASEARATLGLCPLLGSPSSRAETNHALVAETHVTADSRRSATN